MTTRASHVFTTVIDAFATHHLLHRIQGPRPDEHTRTVIGATMATLGYAFGPALEQRIAELGDAELSAKTKRDLLTAAGFAAGGGILGYFLGTEAYESAQLRQHNSEQPLAHPAITKEIANAQRVSQPGKPSALYLGLSIGWLGYSTLIQQQNADEQHRQWWGLGAGVIGHAFGPEFFEKVKDLVVPSDTPAYARELHQRGGIALGALLGAGTGLYAARKHNYDLFRRLEPTPGTRT